MQQVFGTKGMIVAIGFSASVLALTLVYMLTLYGTILLGSVAAVCSDMDPFAVFGEGLRRVGWKSPLLSMMFLLAGILAGLGFFACCVGILFTFPLMTNVVALHYAYFFGVQQDMPVAPGPNYPPPSIPG
jgi:hypothetical protein